MKKSYLFLLWLTAGIAAAWSVYWLFPRAYPLFPRGWEVSKAEAEAIALERLSDLGELPQTPYVLINLEQDAVLEHRLLSSLATRSADDVITSRLARGLKTWEIRLFETGARATDWSFMAAIAPDGEITNLRMRVAPDQGSGAIDPGVAREVADRFLVEQGFVLADFEEPEARSRQLQSRTDLVLRYPDSEALLGDSFPYGIEVTFAGDRLAGFSAYYDDPDAAEIQNGFQPVILLNQGWIFITVLLLPIVAIPFLRRYHAGEIGVRRGIQIALTVVGCGVFMMLFCARAAAAGWSIAVLTRPQVTAVVASQMVLLFFFPIALLALLSWSVGESICRQSGGSKLAAFDALFQGKWTNATFSWAALRGSVGGLVLLAGTWFIVSIAQSQGAWTYSSFLLGPWWENASWFSLPLLAFGTAYSLYAGLLGRLLIASVAVRLLGKWAGFALATLMCGLLFFPILIVFPLGWNAIFWFIGPAFLIVLFLRYGILTSILASLTAFVVKGAVPFIDSPDASLQFQSSFALLLLAIPLIVSFRYLLSDKKFLYRYEDVPPHVRRIANRERQKVELETARRIQTSILPDLPPELNGVRMAHTYLPATEVGGDFYDVLALEDGRLALAVGDVAGHGVSSGLVMSMAKSALAVQVTFDPEVGAVFETLNRMVFQSARKRLFATLCYAVLDPKRRELFYASAGHLFPYRVTEDSRVEALESVSYPLGVRNEIDVHVRAANLAAGDQLFLFSDGVVEARAENSDELFGFERLEQSLSRHAGKDVFSLRDGVLEDLETFTNGAPREDDLTLLVLRVP